jgi:N-methylhydantoinase A
VITFDMGGTSCDVALIVGGHPDLGSGRTIAGRHVALPSLDIDTVSAGGGTLASVDEHGVLTVGPDSAGSVPGPACYGRGGQRPTVTDANLLLGYLSGDSRLGGSLALDEQAARQAMREHVGEPLRLDVLDAARGVVDVVNIQMQEAIKGISTARGHDLRDFTLIGFGGAGPVHAAALADELHMAGVLIPANPGVLSALGLLMADVQHDYLQSRLDELFDLTVEQVAATFDRLIEQARTDLRTEGFTDDQIECDLALDMRYAGQGYDVRVPIESTMLNNGFDILRKAFDDEHLERFGHSAPNEPVEVVSYRVTGRGLVPDVPMAAATSSGRTLADAYIATRPVRFGEQTVGCPVYARDRLEPGMEFVGPAIIDQEDTTVVILPGQPTRIDAWLNLHLGQRSKEGME